ncbi:unnamed protein product [Rangifer tarandus platyrhynchus]|uniref:Basic proline-rich protein-like n=1 Tax=Rangifer tarandus platyrhynchus TaxID=3082113 RepID=A0ABN8YH15_RANTA|nr:unnamed protein product [Rangifer tarandus platyrhynchus]
MPCEAVTLAEQQEPSTSQPHKTRNNVFVPEGFQLPEQAPCSEASSELETREPGLRPGFINIRTWRKGGPRNTGEKLGREVRDSWEGRNRGVLTPWTTLAPVPGLFGAPESLRASGGRRAPSPRLQAPGPQAPTPASPARAGCPLKVTADKTPASAGRVDPGRALARALVGQWFPGTSARGREASREEERDRRRGEEAQSPGPGRPCLTCAGSASEMLPLPLPLVRARPGPAPLRLRLLCRRCPALASPRRPAAARPPARLPPSHRRRLCRRCTALCPPPSLSPSPPAPSSPARSPSALPKLRTESVLRDPELAVQPAPSPARALGGPGSGCPAFPRARSSGTSISTSSLPPPPISRTLGGTLFPGHVTLDLRQEVGHTEPQQPQRLSGVSHPCLPVLLEKSVTEEPAKPRGVPGMHARLLGEPTVGSLPLPPLPHLISYNTAMCPASWAALRMHHGPGRSYWRHNPTSAPSNIPSCLGHQPGEPPRAAPSGLQSCPNIVRLSVSSCQSTFAIIASSALQEAQEAGRFREWPDLVMPQISG